MAIGLSDIYHQYAQVYYYKLIQSWESEWRNFRILKNEKVGRRLIHRTIQRYKYTGSVKDRPRSGRPRTVRTRNLKAKLCKRIVRNPRRSIRKMAKEFKISDRSLRRVIHDDLGLKSLRRRKVHMLTTAIKKKRLDRSRALFSLMRSCSLLNRLPTLKTIEFFRPMLKMFLIT